MTTLLIVWFVLILLSTVAVNLMGGTSDMDLCIVDYDGFTLHIIALPRLELFTIGIHTSPTGKRCFYLCALNVAIMYDKGI